MAVFLDNFESKYLLSTRWLFTLAAIFLLVGILGTFAWFIWERMSGPSTNPSAYFNDPPWEILRAEVLPTPLLSTLTEPDEDGGHISTATSEPISIDPNVVAVVELFDGMYERDPTWSFSSYISPSTLATFLSNAIALEDDERKRFNEALRNYAAKVANDPMMDRLATNSDRISTLSKTIELFISNYQQSLNAAKDLASSAQFQAQASVIPDLLIVGRNIAFCVAALFVLGLLMVLMRVESHLARVANREES